METGKDLRLRQTFLSTLSLRRATHFKYALLPPLVFSIHALLAESDLKTPCVRLSTAVFLSTLSLRRATSTSGILRFYPFIFYPRSPCGERPFLSLPFRAVWIVFYPRSPCGERQSSIEEVSKYVVFSIHALLAESDHRQSDYLYLGRLFYPRSPCGERPFHERSCII